MKRYVWLVLFAALCGCTEKVNAQNKDWGYLERYREENRQLSESGGTEVKVVFLGNSITEKWARFHPEFFTENGYVGRGISGQTSYQFLVRFRQDVIDLHPKVVVINAGTNDVAENTHPYSEERTMGNIMTLVELARAHKIKVVLSSVLPAAAFGWNPSVKDGASKIASLNARIRAYAKENKIPYIDYYSAMVYGEERALNPAYTKDGVHPTPSGYDVMENIVQATLRKMVR